ALDQATAIGTGEEAQVQASVGESIKWLLKCPFDRSEGLRQKVIAIVDGNDDLLQLQKHGFTVVEVNESLEEIEGTIDAVWTNKALPAPITDQLQAKNVKVIWNESNENIETAETFTVTNKNILTEVIRIKTLK